MNAMKKTAREYKFRAECQGDADLVRSHLAPWLERWQMNECHDILEDGTSYRLPDVEVEFTISESGPSKGELKWLVNSIVDCHVAAESLEGAAEFTGQRYRLDESDCIVSPPHASMLAESGRTLERYRQYLGIQLERLDEARRSLACTLAAAVRLSGSTTRKAPRRARPTSTAAT